MLKTALLSLFVCLCVQAQTPTWSIQLLPGYKPFNQDNLVICRLTKPRDIKSIRNTPDFSPECLLDLSFGSGEHYA